MQEFVPAPPLVVPYDPAWERTYQQEADLIAEALAGVPHAIEHIGSTAVPGLPAKPVIDLMVGVADYRCFDGEFTERRSDSELGLTVEPEFVVSAAHILDERVSGDDHLAGHLHGKAATA